MSSIPTSVASLWNPLARLAPKTLAAWPEMHRVNGNGEVTRDYALEPTAMAIVAP